MELVIKVDEKEYERLLDKKQRFCNMTKYELKIASGTPLPKGHGELIDRNELVDKWDYPIGESEFNQIIMYPPTLIAKDKGE